MTLLGNEVAANVISEDELIWKQSGPLVQYTWCPYKKGEFAHRHRHAWREDNAKALGEDGQQWPGEGLAAGAASQHLDFRVPATRSVRRTLLLFKLPSLWPLLQQPQETNTHSSGVRSRYC